MPTVRYQPLTSVFAIPIFLSAGSLAWAQSAANSPDFFELKVRPVLANNCYACHTNSAMGDLRLDSREAMLKGGKRGASIAAGDPDNSLLMKAVRQTGD